MDLIGCRLSSLDGIFGRKEEERKEGKGRKVRSY